MDHIYGIQKAIKYIEEHLTEKIDYENVAKQAYTSSYYFQKIFFAVCGVTVGEYVRNRRMFLAARDLATKDDKVIDIAMQYGYETPESFARAFTRFHGVSPSAVKNGAPYKIYLPLSVKITLTGGRTMDYRIVNTEAFEILVKEKRFPKNKEINGKEISAFWQESMQNGTIARLIPYVNEKNLFRDSIIGIGWEEEGEKSDFPYGIGVHYGGKEILDEDLKLVTIPKSTFIVFPIYGQAVDVFHETCAYIYTEFFPNSEYVPSGFEIEAYPDGNTNTPDYRWELWLHVEKRK